MKDEGVGGMTEREQTTGHDLALMRRVVGHVCAECGEAFTGIKRARYCSRVCANRAYRSRWRASEPSPEATKAPDLIELLDATRAAISRGRVFEDSTPVIRAAREGRLDDGAADGMDLIERLDATAAAIARGREFEDSTPLIRAARSGALDES